MRGAPAAAAVGAFALLAIAPAGDGDGDRRPAPIPADFALTLDGRCYQFVEKRRQSLFTREKR